ncbi:serine/arginine repetitive matrix protein 3 isoform X2 [Pan troglodytes]|uniref:serine/arginine repetitive matrix protein 3 isoform X2 n=1 Tax=Pan troglodytes TaxID=9598 RepID=UPI0030135C4E
MLVMPNALKSREQCWGRREDLGRIRTLLSPRVPDSQPPGCEAETKGANPAEPACTDPAPRSKRGASGPGQRGSRSPKAPRAATAGPGADEQRKRVQRRRRREHAPEGPGARGRGGRQAAREAPSRGEVKEDDFPPILITPQSSPPKTDSAGSPRPGASCWIQENSGTQTVHYRGSGARSKHFIGSETASNPEPSARPRLESEPKACELGYPTSVFTLTRKSDTPGRPVNEY